ncbi:MAG: hypothetical protein OXI39_14185 [Gemmatimonadota bacterium]|uniref:hypothetical protein n=1 Tax=Candidatus Palauibacter scopulicola TaxID=3056741 RepID=UPI00239DA81A|nr:hypothetical protein [Candidatus Palauibacter scopulicola]MDE2664135.1 hypothetical protein [Candidatus Palauibacter scopulicola]
MDRKPIDRNPKAATPRQLAWLALAGIAAPGALEAQACLGFSGNGFLSGSGAVWRESSEDVTGLGGAAGFDLGLVAATGHYVKFSGADEFDQEFEFEDARASVALKLPLPVLSVCPLATVGVGGVLSRNFDELPYKSETVYGVGVAVGQRFGAPGSGLAIIPSATVSIENYSVDRLYDDIVEGDREVSAVIRGGVTVEIGSIHARPYVAFTTAEDSHLIAGALLGVTF